MPRRVSDTRTRHRRVAFDVGILWAAQLSIALVTFLSQILLTRSLHQEGYGVLATAVASVGLVATVSGFGIGPFWLRIFGEEGWGGHRWVRPSFLACGLSVGLAFLGIALWAWSGAFAGPVAVSMLLLMGLVIGQASASLGGAVLQLEGKYRKLAGIQLTPYICRMCVALGILLGGGGYQHASIGFTVSALAGASLFLPALKRAVMGRMELVGHVEPLESVSSSTNEHVPTVARVIRGSWPFALSALFYLVYFQIDISLLGILLSSSDAGVYSIAAQVMIVIYMLPTVGYQKFLMPHIHRWAVHDKTRLWRIFHSTMNAVFALAIPLMAVTASVSDRVVPALFGSGFVRTGYALVVLSLNIPIRFYATALGSLLYTGNNMPSKVAYQGIAASVNVCLNLLLIPRLGIVGAAAATVATELTLMLLYMQRVHSHVFDGRRLRELMPERPLLLFATIFACGVAILAAKPDPLLQLLLLGAGAVVGTILIMGQVKRLRRIGAVADAQQTNGDHGGGCS